MHIIVLENEPSSFRGGQELSLLDVCRGLSQRGHIITLLYLQEGNLLDSYRDFCSEIIKINGYRIERKNLIYSLRNFLIDNIKIKTTQKSLVYSNQYHDSFFAHTLAISKNIPFICHLRLPPPIKTLGVQWSLGMYGAKRLIAVSQQTKLDWVNRGFSAHKIEVVYNGINPQIFQPLTESNLFKKQWNIPEGMKVISYVGRLDKVKGIEILLKGFYLFIQKDTRTKLLIAGKPLCQNSEYRQSLEKLVMDLGIEKYVTFLGHLTNPVPLYQISDITVLPSLYSEPFGRSVIESMACGTPVVASQIGGISEILTGEFENGLFQSGNPQDLADTLNRVLKWKVLDQNLSLKCREYILSNFNLERMIKGIEKVMLDVVK